MSLSISSGYKNSLHRNLFIELKMAVIVLTMKFKMYKRKKVSKVVRQTFYHGVF